MGDLFRKHQDAPAGQGKDRARQAAKEILLGVGGRENIRSMEHCATRLRLILRDKEKVSAEKIESIDGVKGQFFAAAQYQIILGTGFVDKVYQVLMEGPGDFQGADHRESAYAEMNLAQKISRTLGDVFVPIIPVLVATGLFMGLRGLAQHAGFVFSDSVLCLSQILTDTAFLFLPALVTWSTMKKFGGNPVIGIVLGLMLVAPQLPNGFSIAEGSVQPLLLHAFGTDIPLIGYQGSVLPALVLGIFAAWLQKKLQRVIPEVLDLIVTPFLTLFLSLLLGILFIGPVMHAIEIGVFEAVRSFLALPYGIGGAIVGGLHQVIVVSGVHHVFNALEIELLTKTHQDAFNAIITGAIAAQGGPHWPLLFVRGIRRSARFMYLRRSLLFWGLPNRLFSESICVSVSPFCSLWPVGLWPAVLPGPCIWLVREWGLRFCPACSYIWIIWGLIYWSTDWDLGWRLP